MSAQPNAPVVVVRKKKGHGGHHGGAWKVAYADFVTAMMALFLVLWLLASDEKVRKAVGGYFQDPTGRGNLMGTTLSGTGEGLALKREDMDNLKDKLQQALRQAIKLERVRQNVQITVTGEGLRIELLEDEKGVFFESGSARPTSNGEELIIRLAQELGQLPNKIYLEGHTDARPFSGSGEYTNWELSTDRANAARRIMQAHGLRPDQVAQVRGYADQRLRLPQDPTHASNRRISVIVQYLNAPQAPSTEPQQKPPSPVSLSH
ncbi:MAG: flagellar motor protein MotB [Bryobacterales bacterium]|nr:OmpA family protein [Bryobacteraceae bacterium]MDW8130960.1 flagellar motor protein MotB [Bryobacterales bacterium]